jgi:hypothetical protein
LRALFLGPISRFSGGSDKALSIADTRPAIDTDGTIQGTGVEARRIAALVDGGMSAAEILRDYPNLTAEQLDAALDYAKANPNSGRTFPPGTAKAALRRGRRGLARAFAAARDDREA